jgi:hypothetical protein
MEFAANFLADHLLRNSADTYLLFEILIRNALFLCLFFQIVNAGQPHLLPHLVKPLHQFRFAGDAQVLAAFQQKLLVDQIAQGICLRFGCLALPVRGVSLLQLFQPGRLGLFHIGPGNDLVIDAGDDFVNDIVSAKGHCQQQHGRRK